MENYFNYFTEIEEHFQRKRGSVLLLSTLDWALIETWREAGVPLEAVLRGIDATFEKYEQRRARSRSRRINGLAYCAQEVMAAVEEMREAAAGASPTQPGSHPAAPGFEADRIASHLERCAKELRAAHFEETAQRLLALAVGVRVELHDLEDLERTLTTLEEKLFAQLLTMTPEDELRSLRTQAEQELAPYKRRMSAVQIRQIEQQFVHKRLLERYRLPRLSLFYMDQP